MIEARYYQKQKDNQVKCTLCPHQCQILDGQKGVCGVRINAGGTLYAKTYNLVAALALDPIEKKPLRRYKQGTQILSVGTIGCNFRCLFCQNYNISQQECNTKSITPMQLLKMSTDNEQSIGIAFTYNEPTIWYEYVYDVAMDNIKETVLVTNGYINKEPLLELLPLVSAMNIDIKSINPNFYKDICFGDLHFVQDSIKLAYEYTHIELTFLAIPGKNDSLEEMSKLSQWIADIDRNIPLHIIPFRPMYQMKDVPPQTIGRINELRQAAGKRLKFVF